MLYVQRSFNTPWHELHDLNILQYKQLIVKRNQRNDGIHVSLFHTCKKNYEHVQSKYMSRCKIIMPRLRLLCDTRVTNIFRKFVFQF